uniref:Uncharacterized protein n=1 Tax=Rhizophora mucronata TaxID=61149 RepID=A0A2P2MHK9_RHIMU
MNTLEGMMQTFSKIGGGSLAHFFIALMIQDPVKVAVNMSSGVPFFYAKSFTWFLFVFFL